MVRILVLATLLALASCRHGTARADLAGAELFEIMALDPVPLDMRGESAGGVEELHGHAVLRRAEVEQAGRRAEILALVERGVRESDGRVAACFNPRHGIRAVRDGRVTEFVICYECLSLRIYTDGLRSSHARTAESPSARMNAIWQEHGCAVVARD